jgi:hypothetical protein
VCHRDLGRVFEFLWVRLILGYVLTGFCRRWRRGGVMGGFCVVVRRTSARIFVSFSPRMAGASV